MLRNTLIVILALWAVFASFGQMDTASNFNNLQSYGAQSNASWWLENSNYRWFNSVDELEAWVTSNRVIIADGVSDCDDYAERLMILALKDGYLLPVVPVYKGKVLGDRVLKSSEPHVGNWAWIGNRFYYIEPQYSKQNGAIKLKIKRD